MGSKVSAILKKVVKEEDIQKNSMILGKCLDENRIWSESVSFNLPNKIKDNILNFISSIDLFSGVTEEQFEELASRNQ